MKKVVIELDDYHDNILSITAIGLQKAYRGELGTTVVATASLDLRDGTNIRIDKNGKFHQRKDGEASK